MRFPAVAVHLGAVRFLRRCVVPWLVLLCAASAPHAQPRVGGAPIVRTSGDEGTVQLSVEEVYYEVEGDTPAALAETLEERGPRRNGASYFGMTEWEVDAAYRLVRRPGSCRLGALTVRARVQTQLPRWHRTATAPATLREAWAGFLEALDQHERGHRALAEDAAEVLRRRLVALRGPTCAHLEAQAHREVVVVLNDYERHSNEYDAATGHGRGQGAVWPPNP